MIYKARITIQLKKGMLDPEARAIRHALQNLGFTTQSLSTARLFEIEIDTDSTDTAFREAEKMCERLLANPVIHDYSIEVRE